MREVCHKGVSGGDAQTKRTALKDGTRTRGLFQAEVLMRRAAAETRLARSSVACASGRRASRINSAKGAATLAASLFIARTIGDERSEVPLRRRKGEKALHQKAITMRENRHGAKRMVRRAPRLSRRACLSLVNKRFAARCVAAGWAPRSDIRRERTNAYTLGQWTFADST